MSAEFAHPSRGEGTAPVPPLEPTRSERSAVNFIRTALLPGLTARDRARVEAVTRLLAPTAVTEPQTSDREAQVVHSYVPFPSTRTARLLVPIATRKSAAAALMLRRPVAQDSLRTLAYSVAARALRAGVAQRLVRSRVDVVIRAGSVELSEVSLVEHIRQALGREVILSARVGPPDPHRTVGMHVLSPDGELLAYLKVAPSPLSGHQLRTEARALKNLGAAPARVVEAPRLLLEDRWNDLQLLLTTPFALPGSEQPTLAKPPGVEAMREVAASAPLVVSRLATGAYWQHSTRRLKRLYEGGRVPRTRLEMTSDLLAGLERTCGDVELEFGAWHGDWLPWNLAWKSGRLLTWDWEYWSDCVPVGFDMFHFFAGTHFFRDGADVQSALAAARTEADPVLAQAGIPADRRAAIFALYVLEFLLRRLDIAEAGGGKDDARVFPSIFSVAFDALAHVASARGATGNL